MRSAANILFVLMVILLMIILIYPFLPGTYDPLGTPLSTVVQLFSGLGLLTCIPAALWLFRGIRFVKAYFWTHFIILFIVFLFTTFGISRLMGIFLILCLVIFAFWVLRKGIRPGSLTFSPVFLLLALAILPVFLLLFQLLVSKPMTDRSRFRAMMNSSELISEIEKFKSMYGSYPLTLNALWKDYETGMVGIEKYHYTYDDSTYNIYFEQPRFLFDQFGTREFVVYNPTDHHLIVSHASWHILLGPLQVRQTPGWYTSHDAGLPHWRYFWFD